MTAEEIMDYRGLGSGIIRALKADSNIEFRNEASGDQFRAILWRTTRESDLKTTQKTESLEKIGKKTGDSNQIGKKVGKKIDNSDQIGKKIGKKEDAISNLISINPSISISKLSEMAGIAPSTVQIYLDKLRAAGKIRRVGPDKGGHWEVL